jgi:hypothetical protein
MAWIEFINREVVNRYVDKAVAAYSKKWEPASGFSQREFITRKLESDGCYVWWHKRLGRPPRVVPPEVFEWRMVKHIGFKNTKKIQTFKNKWSRGVRVILIDRSDTEEAVDWLITNVGSKYDYQTLSLATGIIGLGWSLFYRSLDDGSRSEVFVDNKVKAIEFSLRFGF